MVGGCAEAMAKAGMQAVEERRYEDAIEALVPHQTAAQSGTDSNVSHAENETAACFSLIFARKPRYWYSTVVDGKSR